MSAKEIKRRALIEIYARNLAIYFPDAKGRAFVCPLDRTVYPFGDVKEIEKHICLAHIYPSSLGGKEAVVASASYDNYMGHKYEHHLKLEYDVEQWKISEGGIPGKIIIDGKHMGVVSSIKPEGGWHFQAVKKQTDPAASDNLRRSVQGGEFQFKFLLPNPRSRNIALIKSAYLMMFRVFGYEYALCESANWIRRIWVAHDLKNPAVRNAVVSQADGMSVKPYTVTIVRLSSGLTGFGVFLPCPGRELRTRCVLLPGFEEKDWRSYFDALSEASGEVKINCIPIPCPAIKALASPRWKFAGHRWWREVFNGVT